MDRVAIVSPVMYRIICEVMPDEAKNFRVNQLIPTDLYEKALVTYCDKRLTPPKEIYES